MFLHQRMFNILTEELMFQTSHKAALFVTSPTAFYYNTDFLKNAPSQINSQPPLTKNQKTEKRKRDEAFRVHYIM